MDPYRTGVYGLNGVGYDAIGQVKLAGGSCDIGSSSISLVKIDALASVEGAKTIEFPT